MSCIYTYRIWSILNMFGNGNTVPYILTIYIIWGIYIYIFPDILLLHILYIQVRILNYIICIFICNTIPYSHFPQVMSPLYIYIQLHVLKSINCIVNCNTVPHLLSPCYITQYSVYKQKLWIVLTVLSNKILSHHFIVPMLYY